MIRYQPQPGDRVTSPLLVGEWEVTETHLTMELYVSLRQDRVLLPRILAERLDLTPVAPPPPPEPAVGSVVRAHGRLWLRTDGDQWLRFEDNRRRVQPWAVLAAAPDLSPVVAVDDVADWFDATRGDKITGNMIRGRFGNKEES